MAPRFSSTTLRNFIATTQGKSYTVVVVTVLLVIVIFLAGVFPALSSIFLQIEQNNSRTEALSQIETKRQTLRTLTAEEAEKRAVALSLDANLPSELDQIGIFTSLSNIAEDSGGELVAATFVSIELRRNLPTVFGTPLALDGIVINLTVEGDRTELEEFITLMEESRRIFNIMNMSLFKVDETTFTGDTLSQFKMDMQVEAYFWDQSNTL
jgi:Tfp pilus assembly protein PilO